MDCEFHSTFKALFGRRFNTVMPTVLETLGSWSFKNLRMTFDLFSTSFPHPSEREFSQNRDFVKYKLEIHIPHQDFQIPHCIVSRQLFVVSHVFNPDVSHAFKLPRVNLLRSEFQYSYNITSSLFTKWKVC